MGCYNNYNNHEHLHCFDHSIIDYVLDYLPVLDYKSTTCLPRLISMPGLTVGTYSPLAPLLSANLALARGERRVAAGFQRGESEMGRRGDGRWLG